MNKSKLSVRQMCVLALFLAIEIIMYLTPIGYLRINALSVTLMHVPVIILASTMGPAAGAFLGFVFGCTSVIGATMTPGITSFVFSPFITVGGISGNFTPGTPEYGVYEYKRGYGGFVIEYIGEFDLIINKPYYLAYKYGLELYRTFRKIVYKIKKN